MKENKIFEYILIGLSLAISFVALVLTIAYSESYYELKKKDAKTKEMAVSLAESKGWFDYSYTIQDNWDEDGKIRHLVTYYYTLEGDDTTYKVEYIFGDKVEEVR